MLLGVIVFFFICAITYYEFNNKSCAFFVWVSLIFFFGLGHLIIITTDSYDIRIVNEASIFTVLFCLTYLMCRFFTRKLSKHEIILKTDKLDNILLHKTDNFVNVFYWLLLLSTIFYFSLVVFNAGSFFKISKQTIYEVNAANTYILILYYLWDASVPVVLWYARKHNKTRTIISVMAIVFMSVVTATRTQLVSLFVMAILYFAFGDRKIKNITLVSLFIVSLIGVSSLLMLRGFRYYYSFGDIHNISFNDIWLATYFLMLEQNGDFFLCKYFYQLIELDNRFGGLGDGSGYIRLLMLPIPTALSFGLKPPDICLTLGRLFNSTLTNFSVTPTLFGDCFANFGFIGFLFGGAWSVIVSALDTFSDRKNPCFRFFVTIVVCWSCINIGRGDVYNAFCIVFYTAVIYWLVHLVISKFKIRFR